MTATYLTTDIIVIIVLVVVLGWFCITGWVIFEKYVLVFVGLGAFFIHFYWTKIGIAEIWNTAKWSSMRSSFYRTFRRFSNRNDEKFSSQPAARNESIYSNSIDDVAIDKQVYTPKITSYITPPNSTVQKPVSVISYNNPVRNNYGSKIGQSMENTKIYSVHNERKNNNQYQDLASMIQKQRFWNDVNAFASIWSILFAIYWW